MTSAAHPAAMGSSAAREGSSPALAHRLRLPPLPVLTRLVLAAALLGLPATTEAEPAEPADRGGPGDPDGPVRDDAWLELWRGDERLGWARELLVQQPDGALLVERRAVAGEREERWSAQLDGAGRTSVHYRREEGGDSVEVVLRDGRLGWRFGEVAEAVEAGPGPPPIPSALLRTLRWRGPCRLLLEEYGLVGAGEVLIETGTEDAGARLVYRIGGLREVLLLGNGGRLVELASPATKVVARRSAGLPPPEFLRRLTAPLPPLPPPSLPGWEEPSPGLRLLAARLGSAEAVLRFTADRLPHASDARYRSAEEVRQRQVADCTGRATLASALLRLLGKEVRHVAGRRRTPGGGRWPAHQWLELRQADGSWLPVDPDGSPVVPTTHRPLLRFVPSPRALLEAELLLALE